MCVLGATRVVSEIVVNLYFHSFSKISQRLDERTQIIEQYNLHPLELGLDAPELLDEQVAVVLRVEVTEILADRVQAHDAELTPEMGNSRRLSFCHVHAISR